jgi:hypothetical protein
MRHHDKHSNPDGGAQAEGTGGPHSDDSLLGLRSRFRRRLESFGLGEGQMPLLTDSVDSLDSGGNPR